ncbi:MAG: hypothetical protein FWF06_00945 [Symbiobacteriaceae bacterium]|nr:hypothetical protein [Symbiobacteriaceae bacterium]
MFRLGKSKGATPGNRVEDILGFISLEQGILQHRGGFVAAWEITPVNFRLKSEGEQSYIIEAFKELLKILQRPFQIATLALAADLTSHLDYMIARGEEEVLAEVHQSILSYLAFAQEVSLCQGVTRRFFLVVPATPSAQGEGEAVRELLQLKVRLTQALRKCGNDIVESQNPSRSLLELLYALLKRPELQRQGWPEELSLAQVVPEQIDDTDPHLLRVDNLYINTLLVHDFPYQVPAAWLSNLVNAGEGIELSFYATPLPREESMREITRYSGYSQAKLSSQYNGVDSDITSSALDHALYIRRALSQGDDLWEFSLLVRISAPDHHTLLTRTRQAQDILTMQSIRSTPAAYRQLPSWQATLPLASVNPGVWQETRRNILTSSLSSVYPFISYEVSDPHGVLLGINDTNGAPVMLDIFNTKKYSNANAVLLGSSGSGKTFATQLIASRFRMQGIPTMFICPLKGHEYKRLCHNLGGDYIRLAPGSPQRVNIMEIRSEALRNPQDSVLAGKLQSLRTFFSIMLPDLSFRDQQMLDDLLLETYAAKGITLENDSFYDTITPPTGYVSTGLHLKAMPTLGDLYQQIVAGSSQEEALREMEIKMRPYISGSLNLFNGATNVNLDGKYIVCDVSDMPHGQAICLAMFLVLDIYRDRIARDPTQKKVLIIDEVWRLVGSGGNPQTAAYVLEMYKTIRGYGGSVISATQDINDLFALDEGKYGRAMLNSAKIKIILPMEEHEAQALATVLALSAAEVGYITHSERGHGLLLFGGSRITLKILASDHEHQLITTDRSELDLLRREGRY